ncbi:hypothetical protein D9M70_608580 [compost metagenome]
MGTQEDKKLGYSEAELDHWAERARAIAVGHVPDSLKPIKPPMPDNVARDVYLYVISGHKAQNPHAAMALIDRVK